MNDNKTSKYFNHIFTTLEEKPFELRTWVDTSNYAKKMLFLIVKTSVTERKKTHEHNLFFDIKKTRDNLVKTPF